MISYRKTNSIRRNFKFANITLIYIFLGMIALISFVPFIIMFINSTQSDSQIMQSVSLFPGKSFVKNYQKMQTVINYPQSVLNSFIIAFFGTLLALYFGSLCGYSLAKIEFKGRKIVFGLVILTISIPWQISIIGYYKMISNMGLINTFWPLILPATGNPQVVFFLKQFVEAAIPTDLIEAARLDGLNEIQIFHKIIIPMATPAISTMGVLTFVRLWNDYLRPIMLLNSQKKFPVQVVIGLLQSPQETILGGMYVGLSLSVLFVLIVYLFLAKNIRQNIGQGALKG